MAIWAEMAPSVCHRPATRGSNGSSLAIRRFGTKPRLSPVAKSIVTPRPPVTTPVETGRRRGLELGTVESEAKSVTTPAQCFVKGLVLFPGGLFHNVSTEIPASTDFSTRSQHRADQREPPCVGDAVRRRDDGSEVFG